MASTRFATEPSKSNKVTKFVESTKGNIKLGFLPPHTPQLNPIETQWRVQRRLLACRHLVQVLSRSKCPPLRTPLICGWIRRVRVARSLPRHTLQ
ncbi:MAG: transposase [Nitrosopumilaceae archaeon]|nr:transposase [Nitrosopumilaceae archaeon]